MEIDPDIDSRDGPDMEPISPRMNRVSRLVQIDSDESDTDHAAPAVTTNTDACHFTFMTAHIDNTRNDTNLKDLTRGVIGRKVPAMSPTVQWQDGRITVLPTIMKSGVNLCESVDVEVVKYFASCPESTASSKYVLHLSAADMEREDLVEIIEASLRDNKPVVIRGNASNTPTDITTEWLDRKFGISPGMPVSIHGGSSDISQWQSFSGTSQMLKHALRILPIPTSLGP
jgi:hypothetical protein